SMVLAPRRAAPGAQRTHAEVLAPAFAELAAALRPGQYWPGRGAPAPRGGATDVDLSHCLPRDRPARRLDGEGDRTPGGTNGRGSRRPPQRDFRKCSRTHHRSFVPD